MSVASPVRRQRRSTLRTSRCTALLLSIAVFPSAGMMVFYASSMTAGLSVALLAVLLVLASQGPPRWSVRAQRTALTALAALVLHSVIAAFVTGEFDAVRAIGSAAILGLMVISAWTLACALNRMPASRADPAFKRCFAVLGCFGIAAALGVPSVGPFVSHPKPVIFFIEPSHYALALLPFAGYVLSTLTGWRRLLLDAAIVSLALRLESFTLLVGMVAMLALLLDFKQLLVVGCAAAVLLGSSAIETDYFAARVDLSDENQNLSKLAFLQGWERASLALQTTRGIGQGFQQFGVSGPLGDIQELISNTIGAYINLLDGGTTASKLIGEFGAAGVVLLIAYAYAVLRAALALRRQVMHHQPGQSQRIFFLACICTSSIELFVRGVGYLSPGLFLLIVGLMGWRQSIGRPAPVRTHVRRKRERVGLAVTIEPASAATRVVR